MKKTIIAFLIFLSITNILYAQSGWFWQNPLPQGNRITSIKCINSNTIFAVGYFGTLLKSTNGGNNWLLINSQVKQNLNGICPLSEDTLIACGDSGRVYKSIDGGIDWLSAPQLVYSNLKDIKFFNSNTGIISGQNGSILKTTNRGNTWNNVSSGTNSDLFGIAILDSTSAIVGGWGLVFKTTDRGSSWNNIFSWAGHVFCNIFFLNNNTAFASGNYQHFPGPTGSVFKSNDGGYSWTEIGSDMGTSCYDVHFFDLFTGFATNSSGINYTSNGGLNWIFYNSNKPLYSTAIINNNSIVVGEGGNILKSTNFGNDWFEINSLLGLSNNAISFPTVNTGYVCSSNYNDTMNLKTTNSGLNWYNISSPHRGIFSIYFPDVLTGYSVGGINEIYKTIDGGVSWVVQQVSSSNGFKCVYFFNPNTGFAAGYYSNIYKTTDGGSSWVFKHSESTGTITSISFPDMNTGFAVEAWYGMLRTTNSGETWYTLPYINNFFGMKKVLFINSSTGFVSGTYNNPYNVYYSAILKTTNSGLNWAPSLLINSINTIYDIGFSQNNVGYIVCDQGRIFKTLDLGNTWSEQYAITNNRLNALSVLNDSEVYAIGDYKTIIKTTNGGGNPIGIVSNTNNLPNNFFLHQNYPNPFNPNTKIKFDIPSNVKGQTANVKLIIYDILGREVTTLVNEQLKPGSYETEWDGSNYASGIYFYSLQTDKFTQTKKMVLMK